MKLEARNRQPISYLIVRIDSDVVADEHVVLDDLGTAP
jgi:hypothetical protein